MSRRTPPACPVCGQDMADITDRLATEGYPAFECPDPECNKCPGDCDDDQCPDCHPDCEPCQGKGFIGWGHCCDTCKGMGSLGWTESEIDNEMERRGMDAERRAMEGPTYAEQQAHRLDQYRRDFR